MVLFLTGKNNPKDVSFILSGLMFNALLNSFQGTWPVKMNLNSFPLKYQAKVSAGRLYDTFCLK